MPNASVVSDGHPRLGMAPPTEERDDDSHVIILSESEHIAQAHKNAIQD